MKEPHIPYSDLTDDTLCHLSASGDRIAEETLVTRYARLVRICARPYFLMGGDSEDLIQEGMIGLLNAVREFVPDRDAGFRTYAEVCIRNRLISAIKTATRDKHTPLNNSVPLETPLFDGHPGFSFDTLDSRADPEALVISREELQERRDALLRQLSSFEAEVLVRYLDGLSCSEIAMAVGRIAQCILRDEKAVLPISAVLEGQYGLEGLCLSVPSIVGKGGLEEVLEIPLGPEEQKALAASAKQMREAIASVGL